MAALLTSVLDSSNKVARYIAECKRLGLKLSVPDVNRESSAPHLIRLSTALLLKWPVCNLEQKSNKSLNLPFSRSLIISFMNLQNMHSISPTQLAMHL